MKLNTFFYRVCLLAFFSSPFFMLSAQKRPQSSTVSQECGTPAPSRAAIEAAQQAIFRLKRNATLSIPPSLVTIPVKAHIIRQSNGTGGLSITALNTAFADLNNKYQPANLQFILCSTVHYVDSDALYDCDVNFENTQLVLNNVNDAINVYFVNSLREGGNEISGIASFPCGLATENRIIIRNGSVLNGSTLSHEVGHYFYLLHTHETAVGQELVNGSNCNTAGDLVCDTPADPCCYAFNTSTCTYTGTGVDTNGQPYTPLVNNLMSYYTPCRTQFTNGQYNRMGDGYAYRLSLMQTSGAYTFNCAMVDISAPTNVSVGSGSASGTCGVYVSWIANNTTANSFIVERSGNFESGFVAIGTVPANATFFKDPNPLLGTVAYYRVVAANSMATPSAVVSHTEANISCYVQSDISDCSSGDQISKFAIQGSAGMLIDNASACGINGYTDFSSSSANLTQGTTYTVVVTNSGQNPEDITIWIDLNQDKIFTAKERIVQSINTMQQAVQRSTFVLPANALPGQTRLRIRQSRNLSGNNVLNTLCQTYPNGETEDYTVTIPALAVTSIVSGDWSNSATWSPNQLPTTSNVVIINSTHAVTLNAGVAGQTQKLLLQGRIIFQGNGMLRIGQ